MIDEAVFKENLLLLQAQLRQRLGMTQSEERHEVEEHQDTTAQLWELSEIRDGLDDEASSELTAVNRALDRMDAGDYGICTSCGEPIALRRGCRWCRIPSYVYPAQNRANPHIS